MTRPGQSDVESGALLDTSTGRPVSGGSVTLVDEMPEASELGPAGAVAKATVVVDTEGGLTMTASEGLEGNSNLSSLSPATNAKPTV